MEERESLLRFVLAGDPPVLVPDVRRRGQSRGVSVHPRFRCVEAALANGSMRRALGDSATGSARELAGFAGAQYERRAHGLLLAARRTGRIALGEGAVREAIADRSARLLLVATDAEGSREDLERAVERLGQNGLRFGTKESLGRLFGRNTLGVLAVLDAKIAGELRSVVEAATELAEDL
jgi:ribosomal protein L7Ae-like RNA K-turn-binding protein